MYCFKRKWPNRWQTALQDSFQRPHFGVCQQAIAPYFPAQMLLYRKKKKKSSRKNVSIGVNSTRRLLFVSHSSLLQFISQFLCFSGCCHEHEICLDVCLCVLALVFFVCIWPWHEGAGRIGQRGAGWCQLASGHMVQSHPIAITGRFWLDSDTHTLSLLSLPPIPLLSLITSVSLSAFCASICGICVLVMLWNRCVTHF